MSNYDADEILSQISNLNEKLESSEYSELDMGNGELLPEIQGAIAKGLREFESVYDLSKQPGIMVELYACIDNALKNTGLPALTNPNYIPGRIIKHRKKTKTSGYHQFTSQAWAKYREDKKQLKKLNSSVTPQDMTSQFAQQWKALTPKERKPYEDLANQINLRDNNNLTIIAGMKGKKSIERKNPLSGYQYFISITKCPDDIKSSKNQMTYKAQLWSHLSDEEKTDYKKKSEETFWTEHPDLFIEHNAKLAETALKEEENKLSIQKTAFKPVFIKLPTLPNKSKSTLLPMLPIITNVTNTTIKKPLTIVTSATLPFETISSKTVETVATIATVPGPDTVVAGTSLAAVPVTTNIIVTDATVASVITVPTTATTATAVTVSVVTPIKRVIRPKI